METRAIPDEGQVVSESSKIHSGPDRTESLSNVAESIDELKIELNSSIEALTHEISEGLAVVEPLPIADWIIPALVGAFSAYLFNYFHWKMVEKKRGLSKIGNVLSGLIQEFQIASSNYWLNGYTKENKQQFVADEIQIISLHRSIVKHIDLLVPVLSKKGHTLVRRELIHFRSEIFDIATGGKFGSKERKASKSTAMKIHRLCADVRARISSFDFKA